MTHVSKRLVQQVRLALIVMLSDQPHHDCLITSCTACLAGVVGKSAYAETPMCRPEGHPAWRKVPPAGVRELQTRQAPLE